MDGRGTQDRRARTLAWYAVAAQIAFVLAWLVAGLLEPGYSFVEQAISELGARDAEHAWIVNAALVALGASFAALGIALRRVLPRRPAASATVALLVLAGLATVAAGLLPLDCGMTVNEACERSWRAGDLRWQHDGHLWAAFASQLALLPTPFLIARALWPSNEAVAALAAGAGGLLIAAGATLGYGADTGADGLVQRASVAALHAWCLILAAGVLHATRGPARPGPLVRARPRDFLASSWTGEGEVVGRPAWFWRHFPARFSVRRACKWADDRLWVFDDEAWIGERVERRRYYCAMEGPERIRVTGDDLPQGVEVLVEDDGYRVLPFQAAVPIGPVRLPVHCEDRSHMEPDGTLVQVLDVRFLGVPAARLSVRARRP